MPRGKKNLIVSSDPRVKEAKNGKTTLKTFLFKIRDICRNNGIQMDENGNIYADLIYDDLLFLKDLWKLLESKELSLDIEYILNGTTLRSIKLNDIATLKNGDSSHMCDVFNRIWLQLQRSNLKSIFDRDFALKGILKDDQLKTKYKPVLGDILEYVGKVELEEHEDTDPYEYFTQDLKKTKSKYFGQFYTPQTVTECCVNEIKPKFGETGLDPAAGTSKFMRTAASYIAKNENKSEWEAFNLMETVEIESRVHRQGILGSFIKYKKLADMNKIRKGNAFDLLLKEETQYDYILGNPPYGGTVDGFDSLYYTETTEMKAKRLIKTKFVNPIIKHPFISVKKDTSVLFLQLIVNKLKNGGRAAVVFNGTIMNNQHRDIMEWFLNCCDLRKIIVNPSGTFQCTNIETYSLIFWKGSPTKKIEYYEVITNKKLGEFTRKQLEENNCDIRPIFYAIKKKDPLIKYSSISEVCLVKHGAIQASKSIDGPYNCYSGAEDVSTHNEYSFVGPAVIYVNGSSGSKGRVHYANYNEKFAATTLVQVLTPLDNTQIDMKYLWYYFKLNKDSILEMFKSSNMRETIQINDFVKYIIPLPPLETQQQIVTNLDRILADPHDMKDCIAFTDKAMELMLKDPTGILLEDVLGGIRLKRSHLKNAASIKTQMASVMKSVGMRGYERKKIGDVCYLNPENITKADKYEKISYIDLSSAKEGSLNEIQEFVFNERPSRAQRKVKKNDIIWGTTRPLSKSYTFIDKDINNLIVSTGFVVIRSKDINKLLHKFLYYSTTTNECINYLNNKSTGSIFPAFKSDDIAMYDIPIPPLEFQEEVVARMESLQATAKMLEQHASSSEENAKFMLDGYLG